MPKLAGQRLGTCSQTAPTPQRCAAIENAKSNKTARERSESPQGHAVSYAVAPESRLSAAKAAADRCSVAWLDLPQPASMSQYGYDKNIGYSIVRFTVQLRRAACAAAANVKVADRSILEPLR
jgi:hypothetical protein